MRRPRDYVMELRQGAVGFRAFTVPEILAVIAIVVIIVSLLLPTLSRARDQARRTICATNMHNWAVAVRAYANDNNRYFPDNRTTLGPGESYAGGYTPGFHISWNSSVVGKFWRNYLTGINAAARTDEHDVLNCPTQKWHQVNDMGLGGGLVGYFYMPGRGPDGTTNYSFAGDTWVYRAKFNGPASRAPIMADMKQFSTGWNSWFFPPGAGIASSTGGPISSHVRNTGEPDGGNFAFEDGRVVWYESDTARNPAYNDAADTIQLGCTIGGWWCYYKIPIN